GHLVPAGPLGRGEPRRGAGRGGGVRPGGGAPGEGPAAGEGRGAGAGGAEEEPAADVHAAGVPQLLQARPEGAGRREVVVCHGRRGRLATLRRSVFVHTLLRSVANWSRPSWRTSRSMSSCCRDR